MELLARIFRICKFVFHEFLAKVAPLAFARRIGVNFGRNVHFYGMRAGTFSTEPWLITIGSNVYITSGCQFVTHDGGTLILRRECPDLELSGPIVIGNDVYIGMRTIILPNVKIGNRCIIGAGSVVCKDIPDNSVAVGVPARVVRSVDEYLERAKEKSLRLGHLVGLEKEAKVKEHFGIKGRQSVLRW